MAFAGAALAALFTGGFNLWADDRKRRLAESAKLVRKYRDPLLLEAQDLQSRLYSIACGDTLDLIDPNDPIEQENLYVYSSFLVGQFFTWTYIYRRQAQFMGGPTNEETRNLTAIIFSIRSEFNQLDVEPDRRPFRVWRGQQLAIGEIMTVREKDEKEFFCMGYAAFKERWDTDQTFKGWFMPVCAAIEEFYLARKRHEPLLDQRLRRLQHLLVDLICLLDPKGLQNVQPAYTPLAKD
ncbi:hypothetical protein BKA66DRAFT_577037 [Pyrenochaeta sp. MPI-SDFR-AT-0127]|nr:hypothetical protein BKA66DRAFT_577037 [Pyrenochaeta sp. MPI-SDFR-AT-0127]